MTRVIYAVVDSYGQWSPFNAIAFVTEHDR